RPPFLLRRGFRPSTRTIRACRGHIAGLLREQAQFQHGQRHHGGPGRRVGWRGEGGSLPPGLGGFGRQGGPWVTLPRGSPPTGPHVAEQNCRRKCLYSSDLCRGPFSSATSPPDLIPRPPARPGPLLSRPHGPFPPKAGSRALVIEQPWP